MSWEQYFLLYFMNDRSFLWMWQPFFSFRGLTMALQLLVTSSNFTFPQKISFFGFFSAGLLKMFEDVVHVRLHGTTCENLLWTSHQPSPVLDFNFIRILIFQRRQQGEWCCEGRSFWLIQPFRRNLIFSFLDYVRASSHSSVKLHKFQISHQNSSRLTHS